MHAGGLFHMLLPVSLGGGAVDLVTFNQVVEAIAAADASPAWCLAQAVASSHAAGFLDPEIAREVFGAPDALLAWGPPAGVAKAVIVDGGYRVTGKWRFAPDGRQIGPLQAQQQTRGPPEHDMTTTARARPHAGAGLVVCHARAYLCEKWSSHVSPRIR